jgi:predicted ATPase/DNA-binding SARP family transcriptional activator
VLGPKPGARARGGCESLLGTASGVGVPVRKGVAVRQLEYRVLGPVQVLADGEPLLLGGTQQRALLAILVLNANRAVSTDQLIEWLWPRKPPGRPQTAVQGYISGLRKALGRDVIETVGGGYVLRASPDRLDLELFERLLSEAHAQLVAADPGCAAETCRRALQLWRGRPLADFSYEAFAQQAIARLEELRLACFEERIEADLACGRHAELVAELEALAGEYPLRERLRSQLLLALYRSGRQADALAAYQEGRRLLVDDLGIEPGPGLQEVHRSILNQDPSLALPARVDPSTGSLPIATSSFVGRSAELSMAEELLGNAPLLTLTGPGGTGKTRFAAELARRCRGRYPHGVYWVSLAPLRDPALVLPEIAKTLGVIEEPGRDLAETLIAVLAGKKRLLLLDNAEHLLPEIAHTINRLREAEGPTIMITSRERLQLSGEHVYPLSPLVPEDAVALFAVRATALDPSFGSTPEIGELCSRLDNLPLAIELAAARTGGLSPAQILARLSKSLDLLRGGRDSDPRQQTLRSTIEWSYGLLGLDERKLFARLSVFSGGCTLEAAEEVCDAEIEALVSLVEKSLVRYADERYWMLETIREYAVEQLGMSAELTFLRRRHAAYHERLATDAERGLRTADQVTWLQRLGAEQPNLRSTIEFSLEHGDDGRALRVGTALLPFWEARNGSEGQMWLTRALATDAGTSVERGRAGYAAGRLAFLLGDPKLALESLDEAIRNARAAGDEETLVTSLGWRSWVLIEQGREEEAAVLAHECEQRAPNVSDPWMRAWALMAIACGRIMSGEPIEADALLQGILVVFRACGDELSASDALNNIGYGRITAGSYSDSRRYLDESLALARKLDDAFRITLALGNLGLVALFEERFAEAASIFGDNLRRTTLRGDRRLASEAILGLASAYGALGDARLAVRLGAAWQALSDDSGGFGNTTYLLDRMQQHVSDASATLDQGIVAALSEQGRTLTPEDVLAELKDRA